MLINLYRRLFQDRKGATALVVAIVLVPMMVAGVAAIDMARIAAARTVLQAAVDSAAIAGSGAYGNSSSSTAADTAARAAYAGSTATLGGMTMSLTPSTDGGLASEYCQASNGGSGCGSVSADTTGSCPSSYHFCVVVSAKLELSNLLLKWITPQTWLAAKAVGTAGVPSFTVNAGSFSATSVGSAFDTNNILAYVVSSDSNGNADFGNIPPANSDCTTGVIAGESNKTHVPAGTGCNFELIGSSTGGSASGTLTISAGQYIAFAFANLMGGTTPFGIDGNHRYYANVTVGGQSYSTGACYGTTETQTQTQTTTLSFNSTSTSNSNVKSNTVFPAPTTPGTCNTSTQIGSSTVTKSGFTTTTVTNFSVTLGNALYGECPAENLYGSITQGSGAAIADSLTVFSSANEMLGWPPTHNVNHTLPPFVAQISENINSQTIGSQNFTVSVQCPAWATNAADAKLEGYLNQVPQDTNITAYATYYPDTTLASSGSSVYPPNLQSACSPAVSYPATGNNSYPNTAWWGWSNSNTGNCSNQPRLNTPTSTNSYDPSDNNCALVIQPLGLSANLPKATTGGPALPDYYLVVRKTNNASAPVYLIDPIYDGTTVKNKTTASTFDDYYPGVVQPNLGGNDSNISVSFNYDSTTGDLVSSSVTDKDKLGYFPTNTSKFPSYQIPNNPSGGQYAGDWVFIEQPAANDNGAHDQVLPPETSSRCWNPQLNGYQSSTFVVNNNNISPAAPNSNTDLVANPELGAIDCSANSNQSFGLYWNDMGGGGTDNLIYWNAVTIFTCPSPSFSNGTSAPATLSG